VVRLEQFADLADAFVRVRLVRITGVDLNLFDFDYDLTWAAFLLNADGRVYGRYGGRDAKGPDDRHSLAGLRFALQAALDAHRHAKAAANLPPPGKPLLAEELPAAKLLRRGECIHCHQINEFRRAAAKDAGTWRREDLWSYPLPENVGLTLEVDRGNRVKSVQPGSPADRVGLRAGDVVQRLNGFAVASFADAQYALHRAPAEAKVALTWQRDGWSQDSTLALKPGWRKTNLTWRPSLLDILPGLSLYGEDLSAAEKKALGLAPKRLAFRQDQTVHKSMREAGVRGGDVILGLDGQPLEMTMLEFLAHVRRNYLVGDHVTLNLLREGKRLDLPLTLR
jgi:hypothetical protein